MTTELNTAVRKALLEWGFSKVSADRYERPQQGYKMVWDSCKDYHFEDCTKTYAATFTDHGFRKDQDVYLSIAEDGKSTFNERMSWCPWGWFELDSQVYQVKCYLKNLGCLIN